MKKFFVALLFSLAVTSAASAQEYNFAVGLRGGGVTNGLTVKAFLDGANALEGMVSFLDGVNVYVLYERHMPVIASGFNFYYGAGGNVGSWERNGSEKFTLGVDGIVGLEYKLPRAPIAFSVDYKPGINLIGKTGFLGWYDFGLGIKVTF